jgi:hypothetical protein
MAKKDKKTKKKDKASGGPADAVRSAVERTFQATAEGAQTTRLRARDLVDEVTGATQRVREVIDDLRVLEDLKGLRSEIEALSRRVAALESRGDGASAAQPARRKSTGRAPARKSTGTGTRAATTRKPAARKSAAKPSTAAKRGSTRSTPRRSGGSGG